MNRSRSALRLTKTPLVFVLAQVRVDPIAQIGNYLPSIQEDLRHKGFPGLTKRVFQIETGSPSENPSSTDERVQWEFIDAAKTRSVLVDDSSIVLQTSAYDTGENFFEHLRIALTSFAAHANPTDVLRIGLRYVDLIKPTESLALEKLVRAPLRVGTTKLPGTTLASQCDLLSKTSESTKLRIRYSEARSGIAFPPDLGNFVSLRLRQNPVQHSPFALLDTDHFDEGRQPFEVSRVLSSAWSLHEALLAAFQDYLVTPEALEAWK